MIKELVRGVIYFVYLWCENSWLHHNEGTKQIAPLYVYIGSFYVYVYVYACYEHAAVINKGLLARINQSIVLSLCYAAVLINFLN